MNRPRRLLFPTVALLTLLLASSANASSWGPIRTLAQAGRFQLPQSVAVTGSVAHLVYMTNGNVIYRRSPNGGASWLAATTIVKRTSTFHPIVAMVAASGLRVSVVFEAFQTSPSVDGLWLRRSVDGGHSWLPRTLIASGPFGVFGHMAVAVSGKHGYVAWTDSQSSGIAMRVSADGGAHWNGPFTVGVSAFLSASGHDGYVQLAAAGSNAYVAWARRPTRTTTGRASSCGARPMAGSIGVP
jgi:hypothetical protein